MIWKRFRKASKERRDRNPAPVDYSAGKGKILHDLSKCKKKVAGSGIACPDERMAEACTAYT
jgi:hypothetical protein